MDELKLLRLLFEMLEIIVLLSFVFNQKERKFCLAASWEETWIFYLVKWIPQAGIQAGFMEGLSARPWSPAMHARGVLLEKSKSLSSAVMFSHGSFSEPCVSSPMTVTSPRATTHF